MHCLSKESIFVATCFSSWSNLFPNCLHGTVKSSSEHWLLSWFRLRHCLKANLRIINKQTKKSMKKYCETTVLPKLQWYSKCCLYHGIINMHSTQCFHINSVMKHHVLDNQLEQLCMCNNMTWTGMTKKYTSVIFIDLCFKSTECNHLFLFCKSVKLWTGNNNFKTWLISFGIEILPVDTLINKE